MVDCREALIIIFLDMQKVFVRVPHNGMQTKLASYGISDKLHSWFSSNLSCRTQSVRLEDFESSPKPVTSGVFQRILLGPILFLLYINDVFQVFEYGKAYRFADDIKVVFRFDPGTLRSGLLNIQKALKALDSWCNTWKLDFSPAKCSALLYRCTVPPSALTVNSVSLANCRTVRDLGVHYSSSLNFSEKLTI
ncbi:unnamed protein product, partial [Dicrocoelium dendriticum]